MVICIADDRPSVAGALRLLLASIKEHCPTVRVVLFFPPADNDFSSFAHELQTVDLRTGPIPGRGHWNIKPYVLGLLLSAEHEQVWWIDSDVIVNKDFVSRFERIPNDTLIVGEEALWGSHANQGQRTIAWGLPLGRTLPFSLNSGVLRVSRAHMPLLEQWKQMLESDVYNEAQKQHWTVRPKHLQGDQDLLNALVESKQYQEMPVFMLRRGPDIVQYFGYAGYTTCERMRHLFRGMPPFIHSQGWKPWESETNQPTTHTIKSITKELYFDLSPYRKVALKHRHKVGTKLGWLKRRQHYSAPFFVLGFNHPALNGLPLAIGYDCWRLIQRLIGKRKT